MNSTNAMFGLLLAMLVGVASHGAVRTEFVAHEDGYTLLRDGKPYLVKGAGAVGVDLATVARHRGNSIRTWGVEEAGATLDAAQRHGLTVSLGLPVAAERFGSTTTTRQALPSNAKTSARRSCAPTRRP